MKELVAYLIQNIKLILLLSAVLVVLAMAAISFDSFFPTRVDPLAPATEDINLGVGELQELPLLHSLPPPLTFANVLAEWVWPQENCESTLPALGLSVDLINNTAEPLSIDKSGFVFGVGLTDVDPAFQSLTGVRPFVLAVFDTSPGSSDAGHPEDAVMPILLAPAFLPPPLELPDGDLGHLLNPGEVVHYDGVISHSDWVWTQTGVVFSELGAFALQDHLGGMNNLSGTYLLILGVPEIAGKFADTAQGETGAPMFVYILPYLEQDNLYAGFQNVSVFYIEYEGSQGYVVLPFEIDPGHPELPNLVFTLPEVSDEVLLKDNVSYGLFVFTGGAPAGWDQISQFEVSDFELIQQLTEGWAYAKIGGISSEEEFLPCTPTSTPTSTQLPASATATSSGSGTGPSATSRSTSISERTPEPTERATPRPTEPPKP